MKRWRRTLTAQMITSEPVVDPVGDRVYFRGRQAHPRLASWLVMSCECVESAGFRGANEACGSA